MNEDILMWLQVFVSFEKKLSFLKSKSRECPDPYERFTVEFFFGQRVGALLYSMRTVRDLVDVEALSLFETVFDFSEQTDIDDFFEGFIKVYNFYKSY